jgi:hypothetical protein
VSVSRPQPGTILPGGLAAFPIDYDGCIILGCPAGILEYRQREASRLLPAVLCLPNWSALPLIRQFISARVGYLARISELETNIFELETNISAFLDFDPKIDAAIHFIAGVTAREATASFWLLPTIRSLPLSLFGLGVPRFAASPLSTPPFYQSSSRCPLSFRPPFDTTRFFDFRDDANGHNNTTPDCPPAICYRVSDQSLLHPELRVDPGGIST